MDKGGDYFPVTYVREKCFIIHKGDVTKRKFIKSTRDIYFLNTLRIYTSK